jgi:preprotein translocase subunit SecB
MSEFISPFRIDRNSVTSFTLSQKELLVPISSVNVSIGADYKISKIKSVDESHSAQVDLKLRVDGKHDNKSVFSIKMTMTGYFSVDAKELDTEKFTRMLEINGLTTLMQLSRAYITTVTALSGFGRPINFPMVNVLKLVEMKKNSQLRDEALEDKK